jgi:FkbM family methyltransferase
MAIKLKKFLKAFARSGDYNFAIDFAGGSPSGSTLQKMSWRGKDYYYRTNTSDSFVAYECMLHGKRNAYQSSFLPLAERVETIVDVGANVGASVMFWKDLYPAATIHCFEPIPANFDVLRKNCEGLSNVTPHNQALGDSLGSIDFIHSPGAGNEGGWSVFQRGATGAEERLSIPIFKSGDRLTELGLTKIDILKVDTEGAERMIIMGLGDALLSKTSYICGELHGERDFELLDYLESSGFQIGVRKQVRSVLFNFEALRKS